MNFTLVVAGVVTSVEVPAHGALIDVRSAATPTLFREQMLYDLPTQRTLRSVLSLTPGVTTTTPLFGYVGEVAFGGTQGSNAFSVDGVNLTESSLGDQWSQVNYNWLEQVQVVGLGAPAEYGTSTGAITNGVLRSGSNRVHGMGEWLTIRPSWSGNNLRDYPEDLEEPLPPKTIQGWWDLNGQAGVPLVRDRLWLFAGASHLRHEYRNYGYDGPGSTDERTGRLIAKVDAALTRQWMLQGFVTRDASDLYGEFLSQYNPTPESARDAFTRTRAWNARATGTLSANTVAEFRTSGHTGTVTYEPHPPGTREGPSPSQDALTGVQCCNSGWRDEYRSSVTAAATISHHHDGRWGRHDLRGGIELERAPVESAGGVPTGRRLTTLDGEVVAYEEWAGDHTQATARRAVFFAQDRWAVHDRVTLEPGVRFEHNRGSVPGVPDAFGTDALALRLGVAWDLTGTQSTVVRGHYGRYHDPLYGGVYSYTQPNAHSPHIFYQVVDGQPQELFRYVEEVNLPGPSSLKASHVDQWVAGVERAVGQNTTVQAQYIGRRFGNFIGCDRSTPRRLDRLPGRRSGRGRHPGHRRRRRRVHRLPVVRHRRRRVRSGARAREPGRRVSAIRCPATHRNATLRGQLAVPSVVHVVPIVGHHGQRIPHQRHVLLDESLRVRRQSGKKSGAACPAAVQTTASSRRLGRTARRGWAASRLRVCSAGTAAPTGRVSLGSQRPSSRPSRRSRSALGGRQA